MKPINRPIPYRKLFSGDIARCEAVRGIAESRLVLLEERLKRGELQQGNTMPFQLPTGEYVSFFVCFGQSTMRISAPYPDEVEEKEEDLLPGSVEFLCVYVWVKSSSNEHVILVDLTTGELAQPFATDDPETSITFPLQLGTEEAASIEEKISLVHPEAVGGNTDWTEGQYWDQSAQDGFPWTVGEAETTGDSYDEWHEGGDPFYFYEGRIDYTTFTIGSWSVAFDDGSLTIDNAFPGGLRIYTERENLNESEVDPVSPPGRVQTLTSSLYRRTEYSTPADTINTWVNGNPENDTYMYCVPVFVGDLPTGEMEVDGLCPINRYEDRTEFSASNHAYTAPSYGDTVNSTNGSFSYVSPWSISPFLAISLSLNSQLSTSATSSGDELSWTATATYTGTFLGGCPSISVNAYGSVTSDVPGLTLSNPFASTCDMVMGSQGMYGFCCAAHTGSTTFYETFTYSPDGSTTETRDVNLADYHLGVDFAFCSFDEVEDISLLRMSDMTASHPDTILALTESVRTLLVAARDSYYDGAEEVVWPDLQMTSYMVAIQEEI